MGPAVDSPPFSPDHLRALLAQSAELARLLLKSTQPPRELVSRTLHGRKRLSAEDRQFVSSASHHALRCWRFARACATGEEGDVDLRPSEAECLAVTAAAVLLADGGLLPDPSLTDIPGIDPAALLEAASLILRKHAPIGVDTLRESARTIETRASGFRAAEESESPPVATREQEAREQEAREQEARDAVAVRASLPDWVVRSWREQEFPLPFSDILDIGAALCAPPPLTLRVNRLRCDRGTLLGVLAEHGIEAQAHSLLADAVRLSERVPLLDTAWHAEGYFEVQDAGSQVIPLACGIEPGMRVLDACAGGGGKTMQIADLLGGSGSITACDIERSKLRGLEQRARRLGLTNIRTVPVSPTGADDGWLAESAHDVVLVDAPCSGFGTVRRNPAHKWRLAEKTVMRLATRQGEILARYAAAVRPGGTLVYATCSLLPQENIDVVKRFLQTHPTFHPAPVAGGAGFSQLIRPDVYDSDGFFVARLMTNDRFQMSDFR